MKKSTRNMLIFTALGFAGYFVYKRMSAGQLAQVAAAARQGAIAAQNFTAATQQPVDSVLSQYGMQGMGGGPVVSEQ